jgi:hypothetical protein
MTWQPISTAPEAGTVLAACFTHRGLEGIGAADLYDGDWIIEVGQHPPVWSKVTHWMPLPEPPKAP